MSAYRIYWFDRDDRIIGADNLIADSDDVVRSGAARHLQSASAIEVWNGTRLVVRISAPAIKAAPAAVPPGRGAGWRRLLKGARSAVANIRSLQTV